MTIPPIVTAIATTMNAVGGRALLVGGCVRDDMMGLVPKDYDLEVFGVQESWMEELLSKDGHVRQVGRSFPVWKVWPRDGSEGDAIDVALPRRETKRGDNHIDFEITLDPGMSFEDASARRDVTMNAIGFDPLTGETLDPHDGITDIRRSEIVHVSHHFAEDPLRVLRVAQFAARFEMTVHPDTIALCRTLTPEHLSAERLWEEWTKLILKGTKPSLGLRFLRDTGWLVHFPELNALVDVPQQPDHHPEGCAWTHTLHCMDAFAATRIGDTHEDLVVGFGTLCHDLGKATTTALIDGKWTSYGHDTAGEAPTRAFLGRLTNQPDFINDVVALVVNHMRPTFLYKDATRGETVKLMNRSVRRLAREVRLDRLARVVWNDKAGRPPKPQVAPEAEWLKGRAVELAVVANKPVPLLMGRHLIDMGLTPGPLFKNVLAGALERQLDGDITTLDEALVYARVQSLRPSVIGA